MNTPCKDHGGPGNRKGYGVIRHCGKTELLHRVVYCEAHGMSIDQIKGQVVRHTCDNPRCIEPAHLCLGTQADNVRDMMERGRHRYVPLTYRAGERNFNSKLDDQKVRAIRQESRAGARHKDLAAKYGVSRTLISYVVNRKFWRHVA